MGSVLNQSSLWLPMLKEKLRPRREQQICVEMEGGMNIGKKKTTNKYNR